MCMRYIPGTGTLLTLLSRYDEDVAETLPPFEHLIEFLEGNSVPDTVFQTAAVAAAGQPTLVCPTINQTAFIEPLPPRLDGITQIIFPVAAGADEGYTCGIATFCGRDQI